jgi:hypothetical protein
MARQNERDLSELRRFGKSSEGLRNFFEDVAALINDSSDLDVDQAAQDFQRTLPAVRTEVKKKKKKKSSFVEQHWKIVYFFSPYVLPLPITGEYHDGSIR